MTETEEYLEQSDVADSQEQTKSKMKRKQLSLDADTIDMLNKIEKANKYGSMSSTIRIMVAKYGKQELGTGGE